MNKIMLLVAVWAVLIAPDVCIAQHGGKAEGQRVRFKPGATSAVFRGQVRDSVEIDYELEALGGQELIVRVVSDPPGSAYVKVHGPHASVLKMSCLATKQPEAKHLGLPTPSHCFESNPQVLRREGMTWSATLPASGNYMLSVARPEGGKRGLTTYSLLIVLPPPEQPPANKELSAADAASLETAMRKFIAAFRRPDAAAFLSLFSRSRFFYANNPMNEMRVAVTYSELEQDLRRKGDWYCSYLKRCDGLDAFVDNIGDGQMWAHIGAATFVPPGSNASSLTFVKWRKENGRWVIAEIAYPQA
ncbi:MAG TPA: hypothetical protein VEW46_23990 [Pyrinomonadaceae bacterium]|nr:hypothetical protein [Pyrinomonadaceae bacterium]